MKKFLAVILILTMGVSLAACGGGSKTETATKTESTSTVETTQSTSDTAEAGDSDEAYVEAMSEFITNFEELADIVGQLMNEYDGSEEWYTTFASIYQAVSDASTELASIMDEVPADYQESHANITVAVAAFADMMDMFGTAADAYQDGDDATGDEALATAEGLYEAAVELWAAAVESDGDTASNEEVATTSSEDGDEAYVEAMNEFIGNFEELAQTVGQLMEEYDGSEEWYTTFATIYQAVSDASTELASVMANVPADYQESHASITVAVAAFADMMDMFGTAVDSYQEGDEAAGDEAMATAENLYEAAVELWADATE